MPTHILVVEDELDVSQLIEFHLLRNGYAVSTAATGEQALNSIKHHPPDLILLDLMLPDVDGFAVCEIMRRNPKTATIPVILVTAWASPDSQDLGLELGALDYITKPFSPRDLVSRVRNLLAPNSPSPSVESG